MITVYPRLIIHVMIYLTWKNLVREKWPHEAAKILRGFVPALFWNLVFLYKGSRGRIYADLLSFKSGVKDPLHTIILMKSIIPFFIHFYHVLTLFYKQEKSKKIIYIYLIKKLTFSIYFYLVKSLFIPFNT